MRRHTATGNHTHWLSREFLDLRSWRSGVGGTEGAARLIDPTNTEALAQAMAEVMSQADLRAAMGKRGIERAAQFKWEKTAQETVAVYRKVLNV